MNNNNELQKELKAREKAIQKISRLDKELNAELKARIQAHKIILTGGAIMREYLNSCNYKESAENAEEYTSQVMQQAMKNGEFNKLYDYAWNTLADEMPEHLRVI